MHAVLVVLCSIISACSRPISSLLPLTRCMLTWASFPYSPSPLSYPLHAACSLGPPSHTAHLLSPTPYTLHAHLGLLPIQPISSLLPLTHCMLTWASFPYSPSPLSYPLHAACSLGPPSHTAHLLSPTPYTLHAHLGLLPIQPISSLLPLTRCMLTWASFPYSPSPLSYPLHTACSLGPPSHTAHLLSPTPYTLHAHLGLLPIQPISSLLPLTRCMLTWASFPYSSSPLSYPLHTACSLGPPSHTAHLLSPTPYTLHAHLGLLPIQPISSLLPLTHCMLTWASFPYSPSPLSYPLHAACSLGPPSHTAHLLSPTPYTLHAHLGLLPIQPISSLLPLTRCMLTWASFPYSPSPLSYPLHAACSLGPPSHTAHLLSPTPYTLHAHLGLLPTQPISSLLPLTRCMLTWASFPYSPSPLSYPLHAACSLGPPSHTAHLLSPTPYTLHAHLGLLPIQPISSLLPLTRCMLTWASFPYSPSPLSYPLHAACSLGPPSHTAHLLSPTPYTLHAHLGLLPIQPISSLLPLTRCMLTWASFPYSPSPLSYPLHAACSLGPPSHTAHLLSPTPYTLHAHLGLFPYSPSPLSYPLHTACSLGPPSHTAHLLSPTPYTLHAHLGLLPIQPISSLLPLTRCMLTWASFPYSSSPLSYPLHTACSLGPPSHTAHLLSPTPYTLHAHLGLLPIQPISSLLPLTHCMLTWASFPYSPSPLSYPLHAACSLGPPSHTAHLLSPTPYTLHAHLGLLPIQPISSLLPLTRCMLTWASFPYSPSPLSYPLHAACSLGPPSHTAHLLSPTPYTLHAHLGLLPTQPISSLLPLTRCMLTWASFPYNPSPLSYPLHAACSLGPPSHTAHLLSPTPYTLHAHLGLLPIQPISF